MTSPTDIRRDRQPRGSVAHRSHGSVRVRAALAGALGRAGHAQDRSRRRQSAQVLHADHVPLPVGRPAHRPLVHLYAVATRSPATSACRATTSSSRWASTRSACRPRTPPSRAASTRTTGRATNIEQHAPPAADDGRDATTGTREVVTCDPEYYRWNQWFFLKFFEQGLAYRQMAPVDWCPKDQVVLADEQVWATARCWRCGTPVIKRDLEQWFFRSPSTPTSCWTSRQIDWPERDRVDADATGSAAPRAPRSSFDRSPRTSGSPATRRSRSSPPGPTRSSA